MTALGAVHFARLKYLVNKGRDKNLTSTLMLRLQT